MLKPFLIRDLHEDSQQDIEDTASDLYNATDVSVGPQRRHGLVQLAPADYDEIAYIHPQARLSYLDDDDGDIITVGSSIELAQRLDDPPPQITDTGFPATIHLFDIRRRNSVTDIWKKFEYKEQTSVPELPDTNVAKDSLDNQAAISETNTGEGQSSYVDNEQTSLSGKDSSESFLSAFEREMAKLLNEPRRSESDPSTSEGPSSSRTAQAESSTNNLPRETAEAFAYALRNLMEVADSIRSGVKAKIPELERHLDNARRTLSNDITDSMRNAFLAFEAHVREMASALNNLPESIRRENGTEGRRLFPEIPTPYDALNGLRKLGTQFGGVGETLADALQRVQNTFWGQQGGLSPDVPESRNASSPQENAASGPASRPVIPPGAFPYQAWPMTNWNPSQGANYRYMPTANTFSPNVPMPPFPPTTSTATSNPGAASGSSGSPSGFPAEGQRNNTSHRSRSLFIGNVGFNVTEKMIRDVFYDKGLPITVNLPLDSRTNKHAGFGYITFGAPVMASIALRNMQGVIIDGHCINLESVDHTPITSFAPQRSEGANASSGSRPSDIDSRPTAESTHDLLLARVKARFPPVSQLDAHRLTEQSGAESPIHSRTHLSGGETLPNMGDSAGPSHSLPGAFPQDSQNVSNPDPLASSDRSPVEPPTESQPAPPMKYPGCPPVHVWPGPHPLHSPGRSATVRAPGPHRRSFDPFEPQPGLRRRATERQPPRLHRLPGSRTGTMYDLVTKKSAPEQTQSSSTHEQPNTQIGFSGATTVPDRPVDRPPSGIDKCVSALSEMGYGSEEDGGRQRLEIYAAAAKGVLADAIDMIEEEREAYQRRG